MMSLGSHPRRSTLSAGFGALKSNSAGRWLQRGPTAPATAKVPPWREEGPTATTAGRNAHNSSSSILFLDSRAENVRQVLDNACGRMRIVLLDRDADGLAQIAFHLRERRSIDLVMIASADERGQLSLGDRGINVGNLYAFEDSLRRIGAALSPTGKICLLGRSTQAEGIDRPLLVMLSRMTSVTVEAVAEPAWSVPWGDWPADRAPEPTRRPEQLRREVA